MFFYVIRIHDSIKLLRFIFSTLQQNNVLILSIYVYCKYYALISDTYFNYSNVYRKMLIDENLYMINLH